MKQQFNENQIKRIVVRGTNWVGDAVMGVPALRRLRQVFPNAHISLVVRPWAEGLFADAEFIDALIAYERKSWTSVLEQARLWREQNFDLAVLFQNAFEAALIPFLARVPWRIGYATEGRKILLSHALALPARRSSQHEIFYYLNIVREIERLLGHAPAADVAPAYSLKVSEPRQLSAIDKLVGFGANKERITVALCPGSINSRAKRWPAERYAQLADRLIKEQGADVLLIGSEGERDVATQVKQHMKHEPLNLTGKTTLAETMAILSIVDLVVTNDTGPAHIASSLGRPTLVVFGPTNPLTTRPYAPSAEIIREPPDCAPCMLRDCPIDHRCMTAISVEQVYTKAESILRLAKLATGQSA